MMTAVHAFALAVRSPFSHVTCADDRIYERFAPQDASSTADAAIGVRQFVVGTGGGSKNSLPATFLPNSEVRASGTYGVIKLTLNATGYSWQFVPVAGKTFTDSGTELCHGTAPTTDQPPTARPGGPYTADDVVTLDGSASSDPQLLP